MHPHCLTNPVLSCSCACPRALRAVLRRLWPGNCWHVPAGDIWTQQPREDDSRKHHQAFSELAIPALHGEGAMEGGVVFSWGVNFISLCSCMNLWQLFRVSDTCTAPFLYRNSVGLSIFNWKFTVPESGLLPRWISLEPWISYRKSHEICVLMKTVLAIFPGITCGTPLQKAGWDLCCECSGRTIWSAASP